MKKMIGLFLAVIMVFTIKLIDPIGILHICNTTSGFKQLQIIKNLFNELPDVYLEINSESNMAFLKRYQTELSVLIDTIFHNHNVEHEKYVEGYRIDFLIDNHMKILRSKILQRNVRCDWQQKQNTMLRLSRQS